MNRLPLLLRYWLSLAALVTLPIVAVGFFDVWTAYSAGRRAVLDQQLLVARQTAFLVERDVLPPIGRLEMIAGIPWDLPTATVDEQKADLRRLIRQFPLFERIQRVSFDGTVLEVVAFQGIPMRNLDADEALVVSEYSRCPSDTVQRPLIVSRDRERKRPGSVVFAERGTTNKLVADLRTKVVDELQSGIGGAGTIVMIVDPKGTILATSEPSLAGGQTRLSELRGWNGVEELAPMFPAIVPCGQRRPRDESAREGNLDLIDVQAKKEPPDQLPWFVAYRTIPSLEWAVLAMTPAEALDSRLYEGVRRTVWTLAIANVVALLLASALARRLSMPLASLAEASQRVAQGDLSARAERFADDDIGRLSGQFNTMVSELQSSYSELERRVAEKTAALELANRHKSQFLAQMSHELRTPLNAIINYAFMLRDGYLGALTVPQVQYAAQIHESGKHLLALINGLLDLAKIEAGRMDLDLANVEVRHVVDSSLVLVKGRAEEKGVRLTDSMDPGVRTCVADELRLTQIIVNLASNAVKFTPRGGVVEVRVEPIARTRSGVRFDTGSLEPPPFVLIPTSDLPDWESGAVFSISDTGKGIAAEKLAQLFTDFDQLRSPGDQPVEGTGLGLAVSQRLASLHGAQIRVVSVEGRGSTFWFVLPDRPWPAI